MIFTGGFVPEASLLADLASTMRDRATRGPAIDQCWRLPDPRIYAAGNVLRPVETAAWARSEGAAAGNAIADDLLGLRRRRERLVPLVCSDPIRFATPAAIAVPGPAARAVAYGDQDGPAGSRPHHHGGGRRGVLAVTRRDVQARAPDHTDTQSCPDLSGADTIRIGFEER